MTATGGASYEDGVLILLHVIQMHAAGYRVPVCHGTKQHARPATAQAIARMPYQTGSSGGPMPWLLGLGQVTY